MPRPPPPADALITTGSWAAVTESGSSSSSTGDPRGGHHLLGLDLGAHRLDGGYRRTDPGQPGLLHGGREIGVLREESVAGMDCIGTRRACCGDQLADVEIPVAAVQPHPDVGLADVWGVGVGVGVDGDGADAEPTARGEHAAGDLPAVGDQNSSDHLAVSSAIRANSGAAEAREIMRAHIRKTPKFDVPSIGPLAMADRHIPSTVRVSRGSMTPSS